MEASSSEFARVPVVPEQASRRTIALGTILGVVCVSAVIIGAVVFSSGSSHSPNDSKQVSRGRDVDYVWMPNKFFAGRPGPIGTNPGDPGYVDPNNSKFRFLGGKDEPLAFPVVDPDSDKFLFIGADKLPEPELAPGELVEAVPEDPAEAFLFTGRPEAEPVADEHGSRFLFTGRPAVSGSVPEPDIYKTPGCPFSRWFSSLPKDFTSWEGTMKDKYETAWSEGCENPALAYSRPVAGQCPMGFAENDHNYDTVLGQGNTLGFVAGHLELNSDVSRSLRTGLFGGEAGSRVPVIARFSDFGADDSALRLGRLALKFPYPKTTTQNCGDAGGSWYEEMNVLLTESLDAFPLANYGNLAEFTGQGSTWDKFTTGVNAARVFANSGLRLFKARGKGVLGKEYFSQLPFKMGCHHAVKYALKPQHKTCGDAGWFKKDDACCIPKLGGSSAADWAAGVSEYLEKCDAKFDFLVQVKNVADHEDEIMTDGASSWSEDYVNMGTVTLPAQTTARDTAASVPLTNALSSAVGMRPSETAGAHKLFMFHPVMTPEEHRPVGETNSFRAHFYSVHAASRYSTILHEVDSSKTDTQKPPYKVPFAALKADPAVNALF